MSGRLGNYLELVGEARKKRLEITRSQEKELRGLYEEIARELENSLKRYSPQTLTYRWLGDYAKALRRESKTLYQTVEKKVSSSVLETAGAVAEAEQKFYAKVCPALSQRFSDVFSSIPVKIAEELMSGGIYRNFSGLSERIWQYEKQFSRDIQTIISRGILAQKPAYNLAKDLESYLRPEAKKPWNWGHVYPGVSRQVDYSAQRLARTAVTHAYQLSLERATKDNPFVDGYRWHSSNGGRVCPLCRERDGQLYEKGSLPLDHPNGMCVVTAEISKSYEEIGRELGDWAAGRNQDPTLDRWLNITPENGIITIGRDRMYTDVQIDHFTPCLIERSTGKIVQTSFSKATAKELTGLQKKGWAFNWKAPDLKQAAVYKLTLKDSSEIQGLIALTDFPNDQAVYVNIAESAPHNRGTQKQYEGVGGHLFAIAAQVSIDHGFGGFVFMDAKNTELVRHYHEKMGAQLLGMPHPYRMFIDEEAAHRLLSIYTLGGE